MFQLLKFRIASMAFVVSSLFSGVMPIRSLADTYAITELGTLGGSYSQGTAINNRGEVVGHAATAEVNTARAFLYTGGLMRDLGTLGGANSAATAINDSGQVVGFSLLAGDTTSRAFVYTGGAMQDIGSLVNTGASSASGINASGQIVGISQVFTGGIFTSHAFLYAGGTMQDLGTLGSGATSVSGGPISSEATGINDSGQVVGSSDLDNDELHGFLYSNGIMQDLGTLVGIESQAFAINNSGQVAGKVKVVNTPEGDEHAALYSDGTWQKLGTLGGSVSEARSINLYGEVVGFSEFLVGVGNTHAFLYKGGTMHDLNSLIPFDSGWELRAAYGINNAGQIVGYGSVGGRDRGFLLTPAISTPIGINVAVPSNVATVSFADVSSAGTTTIAPIVPTSAGTLPGGYSISGINIAYEITTTAAVSGPITIAFHVPSVNDLAVFDSLRILHAENRVLVDRTILSPDSPAPNFNTKTIYARVNSLSPFVIAKVGSTVEQPGDLIPMVKSFNLQKGVENSLVAKLRNAQRVIDAAKPGFRARAGKLISSFINKVQALTGRAITQTQADQLIAAANQIKAALRCQWACHEVDASS